MHVTEIKIVASNEMRLMLKEHEVARKQANLNLKYLNAISDFLNHVCLLSCVPRQASDSKM